MTHDEILDYLGYNRDVVRAGRRRLRREITDILASEPVPKTDKDQVRVFGKFLRATAGMGKNIFDRVKDE